MQLIDLVVTFFDQRLIASRGRHHTTIPSRFYDHDMGRNEKEIVGSKMEDDEDIRAKKLEHPSGIFHHQKAG